MRFKKLLLGFGTLVVIGAATAAAMIWWPRARTSDSPAADVWTCSMHPQVRLPRSGRCPICGMALIPAARVEKKTEGEATPEPGLNTEVVTHRELYKEIQTVGKLDYNEARVESITARIAGRVDRLFADFTGIEVKQNDHLVDIYSPELYSAQAELIRALEAYESGKKKSERFADRFTEANLLSAREKLRLWGILPEQIAEIEKTRETRTHITIYAPLAGTVIEKDVRLGQYVKEGDQLYQIAQLDPMWLYLDLYEYDIGWVRYGQVVEVKLEAFPGETFHGMVTFIDPFLDEQTRTVKVRVNLKNPERKMKAGMYATANIRVRLLGDGGPAPTGLEGKYTCPMHPEIVQDEAGRCSICGMALVLIPDRGPFAHLAEKTREAPPPAAENPLAIRATAVLDTGRRQITYRQTGDGNFELVELQIGPLASGEDDSGRRIRYYPVTTGLREGDRVVVQGGFLLDSQTQIEGRPSLLYPKGQSAASLHAGHGGQAPTPSPGTGSAHKH